jgi:aspartate/methionine/tyrosine aminotransferase
MERSGIRDLMDAAREMGEPIVHLEVGEPSFTTPAHIIEAAFEAAAAGATRYTQSGGILPLRQAIADRYSAKWDKQISPNMVMASHGGVNAINSTIFALIDHDDEVLVPDPGWPNYRQILNLVGATTVMYPMTVENGYLPDPRSLEQLITPKTKMIILCNPGNPPVRFGRRKRSSRSWTWPRSMIFTCSRMRSMRNSSLTALMCQQHRSTMTIA